jgi:hypothetical protein
VARRLGVLQRPTARLLQTFADIRNDFAHNLDYQLTEERISELRGLLPLESEAILQKALANIWPKADINVVAVLVYEQMSSIVFEETRSCVLGILRAAGYSMEAEPNR